MSVNVNPNSEAQKWLISAVGDLTESLDSFGLSAQAYRYNSPTGPAYSLLDKEYSFSFTDTIGATGVLGVEVPDYETTGMHIIAHFSAPQGYTGVTGYSLMEEVFVTGINDSTGGCTGNIAVDYRLSTRVGMTGTWSLGYTGNTIVVKADVSDIAPAEVPINLRYTVKEFTSKTLEYYSPSNPPPANT